MKIRMVADNLVEIQESVAEINKRYTDRGLPPPIYVMGHYDAQRTCWLKLKEYEYLLSLECDNSIATPLHSPEIAG